MYLYTFDKGDYKEDVKQFEKIMQLVNLGNLIRYGGSSITVTYLDMRSTINGKYFDTFSTWYKIFENIDYQDLVLTNAKTLQKIYNHCKFQINLYTQNQTDFRVYNIVKYNSIEKF